MALASSRGVLRAAEDEMSGVPEICKASASKCLSILAVESVEPRCRMPIWRRRGERGRPCRASAQIDPQGSANLAAMVAPALRKELGQHHLLQGEICRPLVEYLQPRGRTVLEIGPGGGVLTRELLAAGATVVAWELDLDWAVTLRQRLPAEALRVVVGDALDIPWENIPAPLVAGNLPYNVATPLIERTLLAPGVERAAFLVQLEVGERLIAGPGDGEYGALSVLTRAAAEPRWLGRVKRGSFRPPPQVDGALVGFRTHAPPVPRSEMSGFTRFVRLCFAQRRKTLRNALAAAIGRDAAEAALRACGQPDKIRAEALDLAAFVRLYTEVKQEPALNRDREKEATPDVPGE
jgi:16S rRNA (adenine1518-N6/adenine1519-N6)-dimethyltransferase